MNSLIDNRTIRVFISSTFQDMQDERTELIRKTFPRLRDLAAQRDVTLTEVDLRWGITKEESEFGKVMEICLREVENSIPFFIGIIGNRYGWIPEQKDISNIVKERFPKVPEYVERHLSATEIEMQFGVLDRKDVEMNAFFFIKEDETSDIDDPERLAALKKAVRENKKYPVSTYKDPEDLADQVLAAFTKLLDDLFPVGELSALEKERLGQRAVLNNLSRVYVETESNFAVIDKWMEDWEKHQLVITGASGLGKSALVANWIKEKLKLREELPYRIIYHFVGYGGSVGSDWHVVKALCDEIRDRYEFDVDESEPKTDEKALDDLFKRVAVEGDKPLLIVLDGINQIIDVNFAKRLNWLPIPPRKVKILFTTLEEDGTMEVFRDRHYPIFTLQPLTRDERIAMVRRYLDKTYRKHLEDAQLERIVDDPQNENTLVLKTLLDEIANFGSFEKLDEKIEEYLKPDSISDFYQVVLQNYEADFGGELVRHFLSLIAVSRNGLSEDEILEITDTKDKPILWSQFFCSFRQHMVVKNGLVSFAHSYIREAVEERYINDQDDWVKICREEIVAALENQMTPMGKKTSRSMDEVPYQLDLLGNLPGLHDYLMDLDVFLYLKRGEKVLFEKFWWKLKTQNYSIKEYLPLIENVDGSIRLLLLKELKEFNDSTRFDVLFSELLIAQQLRYKLKPLFSSYQEKFGRNHPYYNTYVSIEERIRRKDKFLHPSSYAEAYANTSLEINRALFGDSHPSVATSYDDIGTVISIIWNDYRKALEFYLRSLEIRRKYYCDSHPDVAISYHNVALCYREMSESEKVLENEIKALEIRRALFGDNHQLVLKSYDDVCKAFVYLPDRKQEMLEYEYKVLEINRGLFGDYSPSVATSYYRLGWSLESLRYLLKALEIRRKVYGEDHPDVAESYNAVAIVYAFENNYEKAVENKVRYFEIRQKLYGKDFQNHPFYGKSFGEILSTYGESGIFSLVWERA